MVVIDALQKIEMILDELKSDEDAIYYMTNCDKEVLELAIDALKKQVPKKPKTVINYGCVTNECVCGNFVHDDQIFCQYCGTELDWK